jgi:hypothetical protein
VDIGVWMSRTTLREKLKQRGDRNPEAAWNLRRWPAGMAQGTNRLFVASDGAWVGYFKLSAEALYNPDDEAVPYTILFDTRTWTPIAPTPVKRFQGFSYAVPPLLPATPTPPPVGTPQTTAAPPPDAKTRPRLPRTNSPG